MTGKLVRSAVISVTMLLAGRISTATAAPAFTEKAPDWCRPGYQCLRNEELAQDTIYKIKLEQQILDLRRKRRLFGCVAGGSFGKTWVVDKELEVRGLWGVGLAVTCGLRF